MRSNIFMVLVILHFIFSNFIFFQSIFGKSFGSETVSDAAIVIDLFNGMKNRCILLIRYKSLAKMLTTQPSGIVNHTKPTNCWNIKISN